MKILSIETSCDETAVSILECTGSFENPDIQVLGTGLYSQVAKQQEFGGVYPNLAKREHSQNLVPLLKKALIESSLEISHGDGFQKQHSNILQNVRMLLEREPELSKQFLEYIPTIEKPPFDAIAVTHGPGLEPALWVGLNFAKALSFVWHIPLIPINHMEGHVFSVLSDGKANLKLEFGSLALLVSGGHTELVLVKDWLTYELIGQTRDDAVGEAFDKVGRLLGLSYPGGPKLSVLAEQARTANLPSLAYNLHFPRPMINSGDYDFSYAGLKTAVLYKIKSIGELTDEIKQIIAREFEDAAIEVLVSKTQRALEEYDVKTLIVAGGVVANKYLREQMKEMIAKNFPHISLLMPTHELSTDNAVMIGIAGYLRFVQNAGSYIPYSPEQKLRAYGTLRLS